WLGWMRLHQRREVGQVLLHSRHLGGECAERLEGGEELSTELRRRLSWCRGRRPRLWQTSQAAMMGTGEEQQLVAGQSFAARIAGMGLHGQLSLSQPTAQGFAINS